MRYVYFKCPACKIIHEVHQVDPYGKQLARQKTYTSHCGKFNKYVRMFRVNKKGKRI